MTSSFAPVVAGSMFVFTILIATLYGGELVWRERRLKADQLQDSTRWDVHMVLKAQKLKGDSVGNTKEVPIADYVDVGVFGDRVPGQKLGEPLLVKKVKITQPVTVLDFVVPKEPKKAGIDPYNKLIDRAPKDNTKSVAIK